MVYADEVAREPRQQGLAWRRLDGSRRCVVEPVGRGLVYQSVPRQSNVGLSSGGQREAQGPAGGLDEALRLEKDHFRQIERWGGNSEGDLELFKWIVPIAGGLLTNHTSNRP